LMRRIIEDLQRVWLPYINKDTKKHIGMMQVMPREIKTFEIVFPETSKKDIKKIIKDITARHNQGQNGGVTVHMGPFKKDKYKDGAEML